MTERSSRDFVRVGAVAVVRVRPWEQDLSRRVNVWVISSHAIDRAGVREVIQARSEFVVTAEAGSCREALDIIAKSPPDIFLVDLDGQSDLNQELLPDLLSRCPQSRVIVLTTKDRQQVHQRAIHNGAMGIVFKEDEPDVLRLAIEKVHAGEAWLSRRLMTETIRSNSVKGQDTDDLRKIQSLTSRERELIDLFARGLDRQVIAKTLCISEFTVRNHLTAILSKLGLRNRVQLILYAQKHGLIRAP